MDGGSKAQLLYYIYIVVVVVVVVVDLREFGTQREEHPPKISEIIWVLPCSLENPVDRLKVKNGFPS